MALLELIADGTHRQGDTVPGPGKVKVVAKACALAPRRAEIVANASVATKDLGQGIAARGLGAEVP